MNNAGRSSRDAGNLKNASSLPMPFYGKCIVTIFHIWNEGFSQGLALKLPCSLHPKPRFTDVGENVTTLARKAPNKYTCFCEINAGQVLARVGTIAGAVCITMTTIGPMRLPFLGEV